MDEKTHAGDRHAARERVTAPLCRRGRPAAILLCGLSLAFFWPRVSVHGDQVYLSDGRVLQGKFVMVPGVAVAPDDEGRAKSAPGSSILMCDDELTRTMVPKRKVTRVEPGAGEAASERIRIPQRLSDNGRRVVGVGPILEATPFDEFGRRILSLGTMSGRVDVIQGITQIAPRWTSLEGVASERGHVLDMRVATSSIPRDVLKRVIDQHLDRKDPDERLRVVRLFLQAERYDDARQELDEVLRDFPDLAELTRQREDLAALAAARLLDEVLLRGRVGQDRLALDLLERFPADDAGTDVLESVREARDRYRKRQEAAMRMIATLRGLLERVGDDDQRARVTEIVDEIEGGLSFASLDRLATFERLADDPDTPAESGLAMAINGWLQGAAAADRNLKLALSAVRVRELTAEYLRSATRAERDAIHARLEQEEAFDAPTVTAIVRQMAPPIDAGMEIAPGLHEIECEGLEGQGPIKALVQLPPEYDPLRRYPAVVSLHGAASTPRQQIDWWAGMPGPDGRRLGHAARNGTVVIAPAWGRDAQSSYEYSAQEHAAVLGSLRAALRRFAIDTDRVFLSGHSMGGDAAWDIALAHPDLWAGLVAITPAAGKYVNHYWHNARSLPLYIVGGELDSGCFGRNTMDLDRYLGKGFDATYVEYRGRGHEHFSDEIMRIFDWMGRRQRTFFPATIDVVTMRPWDRFFWWVEMERPPARTMVLPSQWPPPPAIRPFTIEAKTLPADAVPANSLAVRCGADRVRIWLSPELVDFSRPVTVSLDGRRLWKDPVVPDKRLLLEDLRLRADRQHPFWAAVDWEKRPAAAE